jgi:hypothetical protein
MKGFYPIAGGVLLGVLLLFSFTVDLRNTSQGGSVDFRNRITGARLLAHAIDPYHYKWHEGDPPEYCDLRNTTVALVSKTTVTPAFLVLQLPLAALPYRTAQLLWLAVQWFLLLGMGWLWICVARTAKVSWLIAGFLTAFTYTQAWRWHAERGQDYVLLALLFAFWLVATMDERLGNRFVTGCVAGILIALRPPFALLVPFIALHRRGQSLGAAVGLLVCVALPALLLPSIWSDYSSAMQTYSDLYRNSINPARFTPHYPPAIEGIPIDLIGRLYPFHAGDFSIHALFRLLHLEPVPSAIAFVIFGIPFVAWLWISREQPIHLLVAGLAAWFFIADLFLPAFRFTYHDVFILNVVFAAIFTSQSISLPLGPFLLGLPIGWAVYLLSVSTPWLINVPTFLFTLGAVMVILQTIRNGALGVAAKPSASN